MSMFNSEDVLVLRRFSNAVVSALLNAAENGYDQVNEDPLTVAEDICRYDADLDAVPSWLLIPHVEHWQREARARRG